MIGGEGFLTSEWRDVRTGLQACSRSALVQVGEVLPPTGRLWVTRLDGARMFDPEHVFFEFSDAMLFPGYFGWNWDALSDCLRDLRWLPADGHLIVVDNAPQLLAGNVEDRQILFQILARAVRHWTSGLGGAPVGFKVLLLCDDEEQVDQMRREIADHLG